MHNWTFSSGIFSEQTIYMKTLTLYKQMMLGNQGQ